MIPNLEGTGKVGLHSIESSAEDLFSWSVDGSRLSQPLASERLSMFECETLFTANPPEDPTILLELGS